MNSPQIKYEQFFIGSEKYAIRPLDPVDFDTDFSSCDTFPDATEKATSFGLKLNAKKLKLDGVYEFNDPTGSAFVAYKYNAKDSSDQTPVGYGVYAENPDLYNHEFYLSVDESLKNSRIPTELFGVIANHAKNNGAKVLCCHADENNIDMRALAERTGMTVTLETGKSHGVKYSLIVDEHPGIIKF